MCESRCCGGGGRERKGVREEEEERQESAPSLTFPQKMTIEATLHIELH
jgi:hypothetical protein